MNKDVTLLRYTLGVIIGAIIVGTISYVFEGITFVIIAIAAFIITAIILCAICVKRT